MKPASLALLLLLPLAALRADDAAHVIRLDPASPGRVFEGIGAVSAGASTRLLFDYPELQRGQILDYLFKPRFGAGFQHLKVEIGSGENSTCGSEPSHVVTPAELADPQPRGYEFRLMAEARKRNPKITLDCLPWAYPHWIEDRFSQESADWFTAFLEVARKHHGLELDWISAAQNEMGTDLNWIRDKLRPTLDARGFSQVKLQAPDDDEAFWQVFDTLEKDPELDRLIGAVGYHYVDGRRPWDIDQHGGREATAKAKRSGKPLWASEEWSQSGREWDGKGALYLARLINKLYTFTSTSGQQKGSHGTPPARQPFPFPFEEDFESARPGDTPRYFADQKGTFEVSRRPGGGSCLAQIVPAQGILWQGHQLLKPHTLFGDPDWQHGVIEADVLLAGGDVEIGGRYAKRGKLGYRWILARDGSWQLNWQETTLAAGAVANFNPTAWHHLRLEMNGDRISGFVDGGNLAAVTDQSGVRGMAFLASSYDRNLFDKVRVGPLPGGSQ